jgi:hypothetical protein
MSVLQTIQQLQRSDRPQAERLLLDFVRETFPQLGAVGVELRPLAVSLNSFNGFLQCADGRRLFFKTHTEADNVIGEYYNAGMLSEVGYPIIQPLYSSTTAGKQFLIYDLVTAPSVFDVAWAIEQGDATHLPALTAAQHAADDALWHTYQRTLEWTSDHSVSKAPIHQLFYHRLAGGRLERFYHADASIELPDGPHRMADVRHARWVINGRTYWNKLNGIIDSARQLLDPLQPIPSVVGHGDAHNGNVFMDTERAALTYFDPAFAGRHHPLLDLVKPLYHNVFAMWMYHPQVKAAQLNIGFRVADGVYHVEYDEALPPVREMFLRSKVERVLIPTLRELKARGWLAQNWYTYLKMALFCCPFLTMDLTDAAKFPPAISALGLAMAVQMGTMPYTLDARNHPTFGEGNLIDMVLLNNVTQALSE